MRLIGFMKKRKNNFELLRIITMLMILTLHLLRFTGLLDYSVENNLYFLFCWFIESLCFVAVNIYVILSGYFLIESKFKFSKLIKLWFEVSFYSVLIYFTLIFTNQITFNWISFAKSLFPIILGNYWFITVYFLLYLFSPILNKLINNLSKKQYHYLLIIILIFYSIIPIFIPQNLTINYGGSYSISWFICLYLFAGYIKKYEIKFFNKKSNCLMMYFACSFINFLFLVVMRILSINIIEPSALYNYYSITVLLAAISLFSYFKNLKITNTIANVIIEFFAPTTFGIYLIHENPNFRNILWRIFRDLNQFNLSSIILILLIPIYLFVLFSLMDKLRIMIIDKRISSVANKITNKKYIKKIEGGLLNES